MEVTMRKAARRKRVTNGRDATKGRDVIKGRNAARGRMTATGRKVTSTSLKIFGQCSECSV